MRFPSCCLVNFLLDLKGFVDYFDYYIVRKDSIINQIKKELIPGVYESMKEVRSVYENNNPKLLDKLKPLFLLDANGKAYAIDVSGFAPFKSAGYSEPIYLGIVASDNHVDGKLTLLREFM